jgi:hypothetical protein
MRLWDIHVTFRDERGHKQTEFHGAFAPEDLSTALEAAMNRAHQERGGVEVAHQRSVTGPRAA